MARHAVGRLDDTIAQFEKLQEVAQEIIDAHVERLRAQTPGIPFGVLKSCSIINRAGPDINYVKALKIVRENITGEKETNG